MEVWLWVWVGILICAIVILSIKIYLLRKSAREIREGFADRLITETNTLLTISGHDKYMMELADSVNGQLRCLRSERHRFRQGDLELKEAVAGISHDLRTPLTAICGYLELLEQEEKSEAAARYLQVIENRTEALKQLTEELFRYSIAVSENVDASFELSDIIVNHVLEESISAYYAVLKEAGIAPDISITEKKIKRSLNQNALSRIFGNVISNAIKYSDGDFSVTLSESGEIVFSNHAPGLNEVQVGKLFDRFYTVETARKSTGLGLSIAKVLTEQMHGTINAYYFDEIVSIHIFFPE